MTRSALLDAAEQEFAVSGYRSAYLAAITERAGLTTGALYRHFEGKEDLLLQLFGRFDEELTRRLEASRSIAEAVTGWLELAVERRGTMRAYSEASQVGSMVAEVVGAARSRWAAAIASILPGSATVRERRVLAELTGDMVVQYALVERMRWTQERPVAAVANEVASLLEMGLVVR